MKRIEVREKFMAHVSDDWASDPNLRAEIKMDMALKLAIRMRVADLIDFVVKETATGETLITASVMVARTGDEK